MIYTLTFSPALDCYMQGATAMTRGLAVARDVRRIFDGTY